LRLALFHRSPSLSERECELLQRSRSEGYVCRWRLLLTFVLGSWTCFSSYIKHKFMHSRY
jgi:hypothetical protein